jgi:hypothetical protein
MAGLLLGCGGAERLVGGLGNRAAVSDCVWLDATLLQRIRTINRSSKLSRMLEHELA